MAASTIIKELHDGVISLADGTGVPVTFSVPFSVGDLTLTGLAETKRNVVAYETRGSLNTVRHTGRTYPSGSFSVQLADLSDAVEETLVDFLLKRGSFAANISTLLPNEVYAIDITLTMAGTSLGDTADHTAVMTKCACTVDISEGEPNTIAISFIMYGEETLT